MRRASLIAAAVVYSLALAPALAAQSPLHDYPVRVTLRDSTGEKRLVGRLTAVRSDSLMLRVADSDSIAVIDRRTVTRVERQRRDVSIGRASAVGCLALGGTLALLGSQVRDPDSPGIQGAVAAAGLVVGCGLGALGGAGVALVRRQGWEVITF